MITKNNLFDAADDKKEMINDLAMMDDTLSQEKCIQDRKRMERNKKRNTARRLRDQAMRDIGMKKVRGGLGGTYWE